jgi:hypothetical protein
MRLTQYYVRMRSYWTLLRSCSPFLAFGTLVATVNYCSILARAAGHDQHSLWSLNPPVISRLGMYPPEHRWFAMGFTVIAVLTGLQIASRVIMLDHDPGVARSAALRWSNRICAVVGALAVSAQIVQGFVPYKEGGFHSENPTHIYVVLTMFGLYTLFELFHGAICLALLTKDRYPGAPPRPGPIVSLWLIVCPLISMVCVYIRVTHLKGGVAPQYAAVALQFAYFMPLAPILGSDLYGRRSKPAALRMGAVVEGQVEPQ